ncbi:hypothetical protein [Human-associated circovirus 2]|nr:hypothetical protein [Human-associated circovirus 2]
MDGPPKRAKVLCGEAKDVPGYSVKYVFAENVGFWHSDDCPKFWLDEKEVQSYIYLDAEGKPRGEVVFYDQQLDPRRVGVLAAVWQRESEVPVYRQRGWKRRYATLARIREFQEQKKIATGEGLARFYACSLRSGQGDGEAGQRVLQERRGLPGDWREWLFGAPSGFGDSSEDTD